MKTSEMVSKTVELRCHQEVPEGQPKTFVLAYYCRAEECSDADTKQLVLTLKNALKEQCSFLHGGYFFDACGETLYVQLNDELAETVRMIGAQWELIVDDYYGFHRIEPGLRQSAYGAENI